MQDAKMCRERFIQTMRPRVEAMLGQVADAVNQAPTGQWIDASEWPVREAVGSFRQAAYQTALQMRADSVESAFSPSEGGVERSTDAQQGPAGDERPNGQ